eukprot:259472_1
MSSTVENELPLVEHIWSIPSIHPSKQLLLCHGFVRENNINKLLIPPIIINLFNEYFTPNDKYTLDEIKNSSVGNSFSSPAFNIYGFSWAIGIRNVKRSKETKALLQLQHLSAMDNIKKIEIYFYLSCVEAKQIPRSYVQCFTESNKHCSGTAKDHALNIKQIEKYNQFTCKLALQLISVIDKNGNDITKQIIKQQQMNWEQIQNKSKRINESIKTKEFRNWITNTVELPEYFQLFIQNGIEDLLTIKLVTMDTLNTIGMQQIGHKLKLLYFIDELKKNDNTNNPQTYIGNKRSFDGIDNENGNKQPLKKQKL